MAGDETMGARDGGGLGAVAGEARIRERGRDPSAGLELAARMTRSELCVKAIQASVRRAIRRSILRPIAASARCRVGSKYSRQLVLEERVGAVDDGRAGPGQGVEGEQSRLGMVREDRVEARGCVGVTRKARSRRIDWMTRGMTRRAALTHG